MKTAEIRSAFLDYFANLSGGMDHKIIASSPLVPKNDPTLMFANSGMVQFKDIFTGCETPPYPRATTSQKCVRAGGKHNDLDNVGYTARHHTFFEMLGNFSFGDYFKAGAIEAAWNFLTKVVALDQTRLLVTVYSEDEEAATLWRKIAGLTDDRIIRISTMDNFWMMGDTGPCGPCSEIFYDHGPQVPGGPPGSADADGDRFVEIWNLVFMQYEQHLNADGTTRRTSLPKPSIDTGMGLERITTVLQGVHDNFDIDLFQTIIHASAELSKTEAKGSFRFSHRIIADHLRAMCFLIADGVLPSNEGRGYVLRRIMRRAMRHAHGFGLDEPLLWQLVPTLVGLMGQTYPELGRAQALITETLRLEETRFRQTLGRGLKLLEDEVTRLHGANTLPGDVAFKLYDTYGFPVDLTQDILRTRQVHVDMEGFKAAMSQRQAEARAAWTGSGESQTETIWMQLREKLGGTEFLGYTSNAAKAQVVALVANGTEINAAKAGTEVMLLLHQTPFYAESGGQVGDTGMIVTEAGTRIRITDTLKRAENLHVHVGVVETGAVHVGDVVDASIDTERRLQLRANHSATHLLHGVLHEQLGPHVSQKGSLVRADRFRFDFSHPKAVTAQELAAIETEMNKRIRANLPVTTAIMTPDEAIEKGAMALFGEKYGAEVRVVSMGDTDENLSTELCGGTHVQRTGDIGYFKIIGETSVASGVRRIEAVTGAGAEAYLAAQEDILHQLAETMKAAIPDLPTRVQTLLAEKKKLEKQRSQGASASGAVEQQTIAGKLVLAVQHLGDVPPKDLRGIAEELCTRVGAGVLVVTTQADGKASVVIRVTPEWSTQVSAVTLAQTVSQALGGKGGGGRPDMAQAGGPDVAQLQTLPAALAEVLQDMVA